MRGQRQTGEETEDETGGRTGTDRPANTTASDTENVTLRPKGGEEETDEGSSRLQMQTLDVCQ